MSILPFIGTGRLLLRSVEFSARISFCLRINYAIRLCGTEEEGPTIETREEKVSFLNPRGDVLRGVVHLPAEAETRGAVLLCHGMESNKESEKLVLLGRSLSERGLAALRFDFFCAGESSGAFELITWSKEVEDLKAAFGFLQRRRVRRIGIIGSSMGGSVGLLFASREKKVAAVATIAAPLHPEKIIDKLLTRDEIRGWRRQGFVTYHGRRINRSFIDDLAEIDVPQAARSLSCPLLIIHGDADDTVPVEEAHELYAQASGLKKICILEGADHRLSDKRALARALEESLAWMSEHLSPMSADASGS